MSVNEFYITLGQKLRAKRHAKHITLNDMAKILNKSVATVSKYENGEIFISIDVLIDICKTLNIDIASLLPDTYSNENQNDIARYQKYFSERLFIYWFNGEKNKIQTAVLENRNMSFCSTMYYDVPDINNYYESNYVYEGKITYSDTSTVFVFNCIDPPFDTLTIRLPALNKHNKVKVGLLSTISYYYQSIAMKVVASETPLQENEELMNSLLISPEELKNIKRTNFFLVG
ncbi:MAG: helix-turn-helix domain-containing protein [Lachnospiraceae bacterium]